MEAFLSFLAAAVIIVVVIVSLMYVSDERMRVRFKRSFLKGIFKNRCHSVNCYVISKSEKSREENILYGGNGHSKSGKLYNDIYKSVFFDDKNGYKIEFKLAHLHADLLQVGTYGELRHYKGMFVEFIEKPEPTKDAKDLCTVDKVKY